MVLRNLGGWGCSETPFLTRCVTWGQSLPLSEPQFLHPDLPCLACVGGALALTVPCFGQGRVCVLGLPGSLVGLRPV